MFLICDNTKSQNLCSTYAFQIIIWYSGTLFLVNDKRKILFKKKEELQENFSSSLWIDNKSIKSTLIQLTKGVEEANSLINQSTFKSKRDPKHKFTSLSKIQDQIDDWFPSPERETVIEKQENGLIEHDGTPEKLKLKRRVIPENKYTKPRRPLKDTTEKNQFVQISEKFTGDKNIEREKSNKTKKNSKQYNGDSFQQDLTDSDTDPFETDIYLKVEQEIKFEMTEVEPEEQKPKLLQSQSDTNLGQFNGEVGQGLTDMMRKNSSYHNPQTQGNASPLKSLASLNRQDQSDIEEYEVDSDNDQGIFEDAATNDECIGQYGRLLRMYMNEDDQFANTHLFYEERADRKDFNESLIEKLFLHKRRPWYFTKYGQKIGDKTSQLSAMQLAMRRRITVAAGEQYHVPCRASLFGDLSSDSFVTDEDMSDLNKTSFLEESVQMLEKGNKLMSALKNSLTSQFDQAWEKHRQEILPKAALNLDGSKEDKKIQQKILKEVKHMVEKKSKIPLQENILEYFNKFEKKRSGLQQIGKMGDKVGQTMTFGVFEDKVETIKPDEQRLDDLGIYSFFGNVDKFAKGGIGKGKFQKRYMVMRGFNLYWFRPDGERKAKGMLALPAKPIIIDVQEVGKDCFAIDKDSSNKDGRGMVFQDNSDNKEFKETLTKFSDLKIYLDQSAKDHQHIEAKVANYIVTKQSLSEIVFSDQNLSYNYKLEPIVKHLIFHKNVLRKLELRNCKLNDQACQILFEGIQKAKISVIHLDLSQNLLQHKGAERVAEFLKSQSDKLEAIILDRNALEDQGISVIANGLNDRYLGQISPSKPPLKIISLYATKITDRGFQVFTQKLDNIFAHMQKAFNRFQVAEDTLMNIDFGDNRLSDTSVKQIADLIRKYDCFNSLKMRKLHQVKLKDQGLGFKELAQALKIDKSLKELDMRQNLLTDSTATHFLKCLGENYVLCKIKLDMRPRHLPQNFSSYPVHSMFDFQFQTGGHGE